MYIVIPADMAAVVVLSGLILYLIIGARCQSVLERVSYGLIASAAGVLVGCFAGAFLTSQ
jgi:hypothetical protein